MLDEAGALSDVDTENKAWALTIIQLRLAGLWPIVKVNDRSVNVMDISLIPDPRPPPE